MSIVPLPDKFESHRTVVRRARPMDYKAIGEFFDRDDHHYLEDWLAWGKGYCEDAQYSKSGYAYMAWLLRYFEDDFAKSGQFGKYYLIFKKGKPEVVGTIGIIFDREFNFRASYYVSPSFRRQGYGTEAHAAVIRGLKKQYPRRQIIAEVNPKNRASQKMLLRNGFRLQGSSALPRSKTIRLEGQSLVFYSDHMPS